MSYSSARGSGSQRRGPRSPRDRVRRRHRARRKRRGPRLPQSSTRGPAAWLHAAASRPRRASRGPEAVCVWRARGQRDIRGRSLVLASLPCSPGILPGVPRPPVSRAVGGRPSRKGRGGSAGLDAHSSGDHRSEAHGLAQRWRGAALYGTRRRLCAARGLTLR